MLTRMVWFLAAILVLGGGIGMAQEVTGLKGIVPEGAKVEKMATDLKFTEGPAWDGKQYLYFSDIPANIIYRMDEQGNLTKWLEPSEKSNGLLFDSKGNLVACRHWGRDVVRISPDKEITPIATSFEGKKLNSPNDCAIAKDGTVYFTDPAYGLEGRQPELGIEAVYRVAPDGKITRIVTDMKKPNGILLSPDEKTLYVADSSGDRKVRAYDLTPDGKATNGRDFFLMTSPKQGSPDGMAMDGNGNVYCTGGGGIWVIDPTGKVLGSFDVPEVPANCTFGGSDNKTLYMTARTSVYRIKLSVAGLK